MTLEAKSIKDARHSDAAHLVPEASGLFDPKREYDACGVGFIANLKGVASHQMVKDALYILENLEHRGAVGADPIAGDGAGLLIQIPHAFFAEECAATLALVCDARGAVNSDTERCCGKAAVKTQHTLPQDSRLKTQDSTLNT